MSGHNKSKDCDFAQLPISPKTASLDILLVPSHRLEEIIITGIACKTLHTAHVVNSGLNALQALQERSFDLCIISYALMGLNAMDTIEAIKKTTNNAHLPIVLLLSHHRQMKEINPAYGINLMIAPPLSERKLFCCFEYFAKLK